MSDSTNDPGRQWPQVSGKQFDQIMDAWLDAERRLTAKEVTAAFTSVGACDRCDALAAERDALNKRLEKAELGLRIITQKHDRIAAENAALLASRERLRQVASTVQSGIEPPCLYVSAASLRDLLNELEPGDLAEIGDHPDPAGEETT